MNLNIKAMKHIHYSLTLTLLIVLASLFNYDLDFAQATVASNTIANSMMKVYCENIGFDYKNCRNLTSQQKIVMCEKMITKLDNDTAMMKTCCEKLGYDYDSCKYMTPEQKIQMCKTMMNKMNCNESSKVKINTENE